MTTQASHPKKPMTLQERFAHPMANYYILFGATLLLLTLGLVMVTSASSVFSYELTGSSYSLALRQLLFGLIGICLMWYVSNMRVEVMRRWVYPIMIFALATLVLVLIIGSSVNGQKNWIELFGPFRFQPSEFAKLAVVVFAADLLARKYHKLHESRHLLIPLVPLYALILLLILIEGDLGTAMVITPIMMAGLYFAGAPAKWFATVFALGICGIAALTFVAPYRMQRFTSWLNPGADPQGAGFQVTHGQRALGSGGLWGAGLGGSKEKWGTLPEAHTDFIYAVVGEELGLLGTLSVLFLFIAIAVTGIRVARLAYDPFVQLASLGVVAWLVTQMMVNVGAVLGLLPITGVPLPLVSYGGSSLIPTLVALGMLMAFAKPEHADTSSS
mgnify:CR=1 FL=1